MTTINTPTGGDDELKSRLEGLTDEQKDKLYEMLKQDKVERRESALKNLKENYVKKEKSGYGWKVQIDLPAVGNFEGFKFNYYVSESKYSGEDFQNNPEFKKNSYSMKEIGELLSAINRYLNELSVETDGDIDYENYLQYKKTGKGSCIAGDCLKKITGLDYVYYLSDSNSEESCVLGCLFGKCGFYHEKNKGRYGKLLLKLSD